MRTLFTLPACTQLRALACIPVLLLGATFLAAVAGCTPKNDPGASSARTEFVLGTVCTIDLYAAGSDQLYHALFSELRRLESILSAKREDTNVAEINRRAWETPVTLEKETTEVLLAALYWSKKTSGLFDPAIGPLVKLWRIGTDEARVPEPAEITHARALVNWQDVILVQNSDTTNGPINSEGSTDIRVNTGLSIRFAKKGMSLDFGAIAKGYAADRLATLIREAGIQRAIIDLGGNILVVGNRRNDTDWRIGIRDPETGRGDPILVLQVSDTSVVTSGINERYFLAGDVQYHHILDPRTGFPALSDLVSVTIVAENSMSADALSTAVFILGLDAGLALVQSLPDVEAVLITTDRRVFVTPLLHNRTTLLDSRYSLIHQDGFIN